MWLKIRCKEVKGTEYLFVFLLTLIFAAEAVAVLSQQLGLFLHFVVILIVIFYVALMKRDIYIISLALPSILRVLNYSMPVFFPYTIYWLPLIYLPVIATVYFAVAILNLSAEDIGIKLERFYIYIPAGVVIGYGLATVEYNILKPQTLIPEFNTANIITFFIVMFLFVSLAEELVFRSVLQTSLEKKFGMLRGLLLASIVFAAMHVSKGPAEFCFVFLAGMVMGYIFQRTRSLLFVTVIHGTINVLVFGLFQFYLQL